MQPIYILYIKPFSFNYSKVNINIFVNLPQDWILSLKCLNILEAEDSSGLVPVPEAWVLLNSERDSLGKVNLSVG